MLMDGWKQSQGHVIDKLNDDESDWIPVFRATRLGASFIWRWSTR